MAYFTGETFSDTDQVTSTDLNNITINLRLSSQSVDASTITLNSGVLSVGVLGASNYGNATIPSTAYAPLSVGNAALALLSVATGNIQLLAVTDALIAATTITFGKLATAALAAQADMQSETASKLAAAATMKYHPGIPKAYGTVSLASGVTTITGGYNVTSASDTGTSRRITLAVTMANTNYTVVGFYKDSGAVANSVAWEVVSATQFDLHAGAEAAGRSVSFIVYGQLA